LGGKNESKQAASTNCIALRRWLAAVRVPTDSAAEELASSAYSAERKELKRRVRIVAIIAIVAIGVLAAVIGWNYLTGPPSTLHYRLTLKVDVQGQPHIGSGVIETRWGDQRYASNLAGGVAWHVFVKGEAVVVDLGERGLLFAVLKGPLGSRCYDPASLLVVALGGQSIGGMTSDLLRAFSQRTAPTKLDSSCIPMLVKFRDLSDPTSVELVNPSNLAASFGPGVKLLEATIAVTHDPVTHGIVTALPWLKTGYGEKWLVAPHGQPVNQIPIERQLTYADFRREL
jgi:hypothetical protein